MTALTGRRARRCAWRATRRVAPRSMARSAGVLPCDGFRRDRLHVRCHLPPNPSSRCSCGAVILLQIYVVGGVSGTPVSSAERFDTSSNTSVVFSAPRLCPGIPPSLPSSLHRLLPFPPYHIFFLYLSSFILIWLSLPRLFNDHTSLVPPPPSLRPPCTCGANPAGGLISLPSPMRATVSRARLDGAASLHSAALPRLVAPAWVETHDRRNLP